jgi:hypothetical protein
MEEKRRKIEEMVCVLGCWLGIIPKRGFAVKSLCNVLCKITDLSAKLTHSAPNMAGGAFMHTLSLCQI